MAFLDDALKILAGGYFPWRAEQEAEELKKRQAETLQGMGQFFRKDEATYSPQSFARPQGDQYGVPRVTQPTTPQSVNFRTVPTVPSPNDWGFISALINAAQLGVPTGPITEAAKSGQKVFETLPPGTVYGERTGTDFTPKGQAPFNKTASGVSTDWQTEYDASGKPVVERIPGTPAVRVKRFKWQTNPITGNMEKIYDLEAGGSEKDMFSQQFGFWRAEDALSKEFQSNPFVKEFSKVAPLVDFAREAYTQATTKKDEESYVAADQALITLFNKLTDPTSVVRESEYARTPADMSVVNRLKAAVSRLEAGGRLEPQTRADLIKMINKGAEAYARKYSQVRGDFSKRAQSRGLEPFNVIGTDFGTSYINSSQGTPTDEQIKNMTPEELKKYLGVE